MATYTRLELRNQVMYDLAILDAAEAPNAADSVFVLDRIQQTLEGLADDGLIPFDLDGDTIPAPYMVPVARCVAPSLCMAYGLGDKLATYQALADGAVRTLRRLKSKPYFGAPATATYY